MCQYWTPDLLCRLLTVPPAYFRRYRASRIPTVPPAYCAARLLPALSRLPPAYCTACLLCRLIFDLSINSLLTRYASVTEPA